MVTGTWLWCQKNQRPGQLELACQLRSVETNQAVPDGGLQWGVDRVPPQIRVAQRRGTPPWHQEFIFTGSDQILRDIASIVIRVLGAGITTEQRVERLLQTAVDASPPQTLGGGPLPSVTSTTRIITGNTGTTLGLPNPLPAPNTLPPLISSTTAPPQMVPQNITSTTAVPGQTTLRLESDGQLVLAKGHDLDAVRFEVASVTTGEEAPTVSANQPWQSTIEIRGTLRGVRQGMPCAASVHLRGNMPQTVLCTGGGP